MFSINPSPFSLTNLFISYAKMSKGWNVSSGCDSSYQHKSSSPLFPSSHFMCLHVTLHIELKIVSLQEGFSIASFNSFTPYLYNLGPLK